MGPEHADVFPEVAVARRVVLLLSGTDTGSPGDASAAAVPWATLAPEQSEVV
jgi:hypothetical protein